MLRRTLNSLAIFLAGAVGGLRKTAWGGRATRATSRNLAQDLGLPLEVVSRVLDQAAADLRDLAANGDAADARPIINKAVNELAKFGFHSQPFDTEAMDRCLKDLAEPDLVILRHFKEGMRHTEIAELMGTDVESVRRSLVRTYADLRIKMMGWDDDDGAAVVPDNGRKRVRTLLAGTKPGPALKPS